MAVVDDSIGNEFAAGQLGAEDWVRGFILLCSLEEHHENVVIEKLLDLRVIDSRVCVATFCWPVKTAVESVAEVIVDTLSVPGVGAIDVYCFFV